MLTASIVTYKNDFEKLSQAIFSFLNTDAQVKLYIVDNSPTSVIRNLCYDKRIEYIATGKNLGFGKAHNIVINNLPKIKSKYHLVLNPDVYFDEGVTEKLVDYMNQNESVGLVMPKVLYPSGNIQHNCKLLPTPYNLFVRRFMYFDQQRVKESNYSYEMQFADYDEEMEVPYLSGCFMFLRASSLKRVGGFDEKFFLYGEDIDLSRRIHQQFQTMYYPAATVYHHHAKGSYKSMRLMLHNIRSAIIYFNKWGWLKDKERELINSRIANHHQSVIFPELARLR